MKKIILSFLALSSLVYKVQSQVKIGDNSINLNPNSLLELESTTKGLLLPRMTRTQMNAMVNVPAGMLVFSITDSVMYLRRDTGWAMLTLGPAPAEKWAANGNDIYNTSTGKVGIGTSAPFSQLSNIATNTIGSDGQGGNTNSFSWGANQAGYVAQLYNAGTGNFNNGLAVKVTSKFATALDVSQGLTQGGGGNTMLSVKADGSTGIGTNTPQAKLDISSTTQGVLFPRMTSLQRAGIINPSIGLIVHQTDGTKGIYHFDGDTWINVTNGYVPNAGGYAYSPSYGAVSTFAGRSSRPGSTDATGTDASFNGPHNVAVDGSGNVYVADFSNHKIRKITTGGVVTTLAGNGSQGSTDGTGTAASFRYPSGVAVDGSGNVYVADYYNHKIRKITPDGVVTTLAGNGTEGSTDGAGTAASFRYPTGVAVDESGNVYVADAFNHKIRKISAGGVVSTLAGSGAEGSTDAAGTAASFYFPIGIAVDGIGNVYVADRDNHKIRKITPGGGVTTLAGSGTQGSTDGAGTAASFYQPYGVAIDGSGNVYVADGYNNKIRKIMPTGLVTTLAGSGSPGSTDAVGTAASFNLPIGIAVDGTGNVYVADQQTSIIRRIIAR